MNKIENTLNAVSGISVYKNIKKLKLVKSFISMLKALTKKKGDFSKIVEEYSDICAVLYKSEYQGSLGDYVLDKILRDENVFTVKSAKGEFSQIPDYIKEATAFDLDAIFALTQISSEDIKARLVSMFPKYEQVINRLPNYSNVNEKFANFTGGENLEGILNFHQSNGVGVYSKYFAFYFENEKIIPVKKFMKVMLSDIKKYEVQKKKVIDNTLSFINKKPANNVLLYGDRGTGKSTTIKAILNEYHNNGLRMIQVAKEDIPSMNKILKAIKDVPLSFIIFIDDLTFNENDPAFNILKAVLEGSLNAMPKNVLIYATTNRRHLIKETFTAREGNELHASDTRDEMASLADRFGLTVTFSKPNQQEYLDIVVLLAKERGIDLSEDIIRKGANTFAMQKASRSGRVASQYIDYIEGRISLGLPV